MEKGKIASEDRWLIDKRPGLFLRLRARGAWRAYEKARGPYDRLVRQMEALGAERDALVRAAMARRQAGEPSDIHALGIELMKYSEIFADLAAPWEKAEADMKRAYASALKILDELGFEEIRGEGATGRSGSSGQG